MGYGSDRSNARGGQGGEGRGGFGGGRGGQGGGRGGFGGGSRGGFSSGPREMHKAKCADCGNECEVPFKPSGERPVYCRDCFQKHRPPRF